MKNLLPLSLTAALFFGVLFTSSAQYGTEDVPAPVEKTTDDLNTVKEEKIERPKWEVKEVNQFMTMGEQPGFEILLKDADAKDVEASWKKFIKKYKGSIESSKKADEIFANDVKIGAVSDHPLDMYVYIRPRAEGTSLTLFVDLGGTFLSSAGQPESVKDLKMEIIEFARQEAIVVADANLETEQKQMVVLEKELTKLISEREKYIQEIESAKILIQQREQAIIENESMQEKKQQQIESQRRLLDTATKKRMVLD